MGKYSIELQLNVYNVYIVFRDQLVGLCYARDQGLSYTRDRKIWKKPDLAYKNWCYPKSLDKRIQGRVTHVCKIVWNTAIIIFNLTFNIYS